MHGSTSLGKFFNINKTIAKVQIAKHHLYSYLVGLDKNSFSCGKWEKKKFPCIYSESICRRNGDISSYLSLFDTAHCYKQQYSYTDYNIPVFEYVLENNDLNQFLF